MRLNNNLSQINLTRQTDTVHAHDKNSHNIQIQQNKRKTDKPKPKQQQQQQQNQKEKNPTLSLRYCGRFIIIVEHFGPMTLTRVRTMTSVLFVKTSLKLIKTNKQTDFQAAPPPPQPPPPPPPPPHPRKKEDKRREMHNDTYLRQSRIPYHRREN